MQITKLEGYLNQIKSEFKDDLVMDHIRYNGGFLTLKFDYEKQSFSVTVKPDNGDSIGATGLTTAGANTWLESYPGVAWDQYFDIEFTNDDIPQTVPVQEELTPERLRCKKCNKLSYSDKPDRLCPPCRKSTGLEYYAELILSTNSGQ